MEGQNAHHCGSEGEMVNTEDGGSPTSAADVGERSPGTPLISGTPPHLSETDIPVQSIEYEDCSEMQKSSQGITNLEESPRGKSAEQTYNELRQETVQERLNSGTCNEGCDSEDSPNIMSHSFLRDDSVVEFDMDDRNGALTTANGSGDATDKYESHSDVRDATSEIDKSLESLSSDDKLPQIPVVPEDMKTSGHISTEIEELLMATSSSPDSGFEINKVDPSSSSENLMKMISNLLDECNSLKQDKNRLEHDVRRLEADQSSQVYVTQIEALEKTLAQAQADACSWQTKLQKTEENYLTENVRVRTDLMSRLERMTKQYEAANKDKESMVMKYATAEREVIVARQQKDVFEKKMKEMEKDREQLMNKNKNLIAERARICQTLDTKVQKINWFQRELDKMKEEVNSREVKIKWVQTKLKGEMDTHKETQGKLDRALTKITKHEEELKTIKEEAENVVRTTIDDEKSRANVLDKQLQEEKARLIMERQANEDKGSAFYKVSAELESLMTKHSSLLEEVGTLRSKTTSYEAEREESEKLFTSLRQEVKNSRQEVADLNHLLSNSAHLQDQLKREQEQFAAASQENERLQTTNTEMESDLLSCRQKESELLAFTQKLSDKNVQIQSQLSALQSKSQLLELEHEEMKTELENIKAQKLKIKTELTKENETRTMEVEELKRQLVLRAEELKLQTTKAQDLENEILVIKRKHNNTQKDMSREMQKLRKRLEFHDNGGANCNSNEGMMSGHSSQSLTPHDALSQGSRTSSNTSLNNIEYHNTNGSTPQQESINVVNDPLVTQQLLVERIVKLQKSAAKKADKIEFLEEHVAQLLTEMKKKSRIIHHYIMKEEAGALSNSASDSSKSKITTGRLKKTQAELMKHGGIMASVYGSSSRDDTMTLDLSLEINRKLQAVLEDTLLKNITLKENLNTLGDEIAKISLQNQHTK